MFILYPVVQYYKTVINSFVHNLSTFKAISPEQISKSELLG